MNPTARHTILFDLDGTLTDPSDGIYESVHYALDRLGAPPPPAADMRALVGPPLRQSFAKLLGNGDRVEEAVDHYRQKYRLSGLYRNRLYPGVSAMLHWLSRRPRGRIYLATAKPRVFADVILKHLGVDSYFNGVYGSELDGTFDDKGSLIRHLLEVEGIRSTGAVMVGDRAQDMQAARRNHMLGIGVGYGFGSREELTAAGAEAVLASPEELLAYLRNSGFAAEAASVP
jgi:phosphoglycolate phosphatase